MLLELIAAVAAAFGLAGLALLARLLFKERVPRWTVPAAAGLGMIAFTVWNEYDWPRRAEASLPEGVVVAWKNEERALWRPWTYLAPITTRFTAVDLRNPRRHPDQPGQVIVRLAMMGRYMPGAEFPAVFDCHGNRSAELIRGDIAFEDDGTISGANWQAVPADDPVLRAVCGGGG